MNEINKTQTTVRWLSFASLLMAVLGTAFYWWVPMGMVLSLAGMVCGFVDFTAARRRSVDHRLAVGGMILCAVALAFDCAIYYFGLQSLTFGGM